MSAPSKKSLYFAVSELLQSSTANHPLVRNYTAVSKRQISVRLIDFDESCSLDGSVRAQCPKHACIISIRSEENGIRPS